VYKARLKDPVADRQYYNANTTLWAIKGHPFYFCNRRNFVGVRTPSLSGSGVQMCTDPHFLMSFSYTWPVIHSISFADSGNSACTTISVDTLMIISINIDFIRLLFDRINCIKMLAQTHAESTRGKGRKDN